MGVPQLVPKSLLRPGNTALAVSVHGPLRPPGRIAIGDGFRPGRRVRRYAFGTASCTRIIGLFVHGLRRRGARIQGRLVRRDLQTVLRPGAVDQGEVLIGLRSIVDKGRPFGTCIKGHKKRMRSSVIDIAAIGPDIDGTRSITRIAAHPFVSCGVGDAAALDNRTGGCATRDVAFIRRKVGRRILRRGGIGLIR